MINPAFRGERLRTFIAIFIGFLILLYILIVEKYFFEAKVYGIMGIFTVATLFFFPALWRKSKKKESLEEAYIGVSKTPFKGILIGLIFAAVFILMTKVKFFGSVAQLITPTIPLSIGATAIVVIFLAPMFEELGTTTSLTSILGLYMPFWLAAVIKGAFFSSIHYYAYVVIAGTSLENAIGAFIGAGIFGFLSAYLGKYFGVEASQAGHFGFNAYNFNSVYHLLAVVG